MQNLSGLTWEVSKEVLIDSPIISQSLFMYPYTLFCAVSLESANSCVLKQATTLPIIQLILILVPICKSQSVKYTGGVPEALR